MQSSYYISGPWTPVWAFEPLHSGRSHIRWTHEGTHQELWRGAEERGDSVGCLLWTSTEQGKQGHLPSRGICGQVHVHPLEVHGRCSGRILIVQLCTPDDCTLPAYFIVICKSFYIFQMTSSQCQRIVLLACGSFNPPTIMHLRLFELARDYFRQNRPNWTVVGGVISPTHDKYKKKSLIPSRHRLEMSRQATLCSDWIHVSDWETK